MTMRFSYALTDLGNTRVRLGSISGLTMRAYKGEVASCDIVLDDPTGNLTIEPFRAFAVDELACSSIRIGKWYIVQRKYERADSFRTGAARRISVSLYDLNSTLTMKLITHSTFHYKRPAETDIERITWLLAQVLDTIPIVDSGLIDTANAVNLTAVDYTGQFPLQVLSDCANRSNKNFFIYSDDTTGASSLAYFKSTNLSMYVSTLTFSNVLSDLSSTCLPPLTDADGVADPSLVYDGVYMPYGTKGDSVYVRAAGRFLARDVVGPSANTSSRDRATELAQRMLDNHDSEESTVHFTAKIPAAQVNLIKEGMLTTARFSHIPGWETGKVVRVLNRAVKQDEESSTFYNVELAVGHPVLVNFQPGPDPANEHEPLPPFQPGGGGTPTYVQSQLLQSPNGDAPGETITLDNPPTAGNFLGLYIGQVQSAGPNVYTLPDGWTTDEVFNATAPAPNCQMVVASKISDGTETSVFVGWAGTGPLEIFYFEYSGAQSWGGLTTGEGGPGSSFTLPSVTPTPGLPTAVLAFLNWDPDYTTVASPLANTREFQARAGWAARAAQSYSDTIIASASGSYNGTTTGAVGPETNYAAIVGWLQGAAGEAPSIGQPVAPESATGDGVTVVYTTNYPYIAGSLVVKINGIVTSVDESSPDDGTFTLPAAPAVGSLITWTYSVADPAPTGANNPPPTTNPPSVPPGGGTMPGGDGVYRPPSQAFVPAETPNGAITVFTIAPYFAGTTLVYINGLIQRPIIDYAETSPSAGTVTFTTAPTALDNIVIVAMPVGAGPIGVTAQFPGTGANTQAAFLTLLGTMTLDNIEMAAGTYQDWNLSINIDRTARPIRVRPAIGATVIFDGTTSGSGDGPFYFGNSSYTSDISFDSTGTGGGFVMRNWDIGATGLIWGQDQHRIKFAGSWTVYNITGAAGGMTSHVVYVSTDGTNIPTNLEYDDFALTGGFTDLGSGLQVYHTPAEAQGVIARRWTISGGGDVTWGFVGRYDATGIDISDWTIDDTDTPFDSQGPAGTVMRMVSTNSANPPVIDPPMVEGTGANANSWS